MTFLKLFSVQKTKRSTGWNKGVRPHFPDKASLCLSKNSCYRCMNTEWHDLLGPPISQSMCSSHWSICGDSSRDAPGHLLEILLIRFLIRHDLLILSTRVPHQFRKHPPPQGKKHTAEHRKQHSALWLLSLWEKKLITRKRLKINWKRGWLGTRMFIVYTVFNAN